MHVAGKTGIARRAGAIFDANLACQTEMAEGMPAMADLAEPGFVQQMAQNGLSKSEPVDPLGALPTEAVLDARGYADVGVFTICAPDA